MQEAAPLTGLSPSASQMSHASWPLLRWLTKLPPLETKEKELTFSPLTFPVPFCAFTKATSIHPIDILKRGGTLHIQFLSWSKSSIHSKSHFYCFIVLSPMARVGWGVVVLLRGTVSPTQTPTYLCLSPDLQVAPTQSLYSPLAHPKSQLLQNS